MTAPTFYLGWVGLYAWWALVVMTSGWIENRVINRHWPFLGGLAGTISFFALMPASLSVLPCVVLGVYLVSFHLTTSQIGNID
jgi:hypothetical protein